MDKNTVIEIKDLTKFYQMGDFEVRALNGVSVSIEPGEFVAVMGPSGSGKSTLMNILGCLDRPTDGRYILNGEDVSEMEKENLAAIRNQQIGFVFQSYNLLSRTTALENVMLPLVYDKNKDWTEDEMVVQATTVLESVGLADRIGHQTHELSGGQRQRVAIARALVNDPVLLLADEPTGNLDTKSGSEIMDILNDLHARGRTIVMVTHEPEIAEHTQRVIHVRDGLIEADLRNGEKAIRHKAGVR